MAVSVYVHVPFCMSRCSYCAFYSGEPLDALDQYPALLLTELARTPLTPGPLSTVYFGGGTPSLLEPRAIATILNALDQCCGLAPGAEVTLEVNPGGAVDFRGLAAAGVNRLSVGVQALSDPLLARLGRAHRARGALDALSGARRCGFDRLSADLLFGLPKLPPSDLASWARAVVAAGASHVSTYSLEIHPGAALHSAGSGDQSLACSPDEEAAQWEALDGELRLMDLRVYEVSNYASPGQECRHNLACWEGRPYRGLGPGAHSFAPRAGRWGTRIWNSPDLAAYRSRLAAGRPPPGGRERLSASESFLEGLFLAMRRPAPFDLEAHCRRHGFAGGPFAARARTAAAQGLLCPQGSAWVPTRTGLRRADGLALWLSEAGPSSVSGDPPLRVQTP